MEGLYYPTQEYGPLMKGMVIGGLGIVFHAQLVLGNRIGHVAIV